MSNAGDGVTTDVINDDVPQIHETDEVKNDSLNGGETKLLNDNDNILTDNIRRTERKIKLTLKGKQNALKNCSKVMSSCEKRVTKQVGIITLLLEGTNSEMVTNELNALEKTYIEFADTYARACELLVDREIPPTISETG